MIKPLYIGTCLTHVGIRSCLSLFFMLLSFLLTPIIPRMFFCGASSPSTFFSSSSFFFLSFFPWGRGNVVLYYVLSQCVHAGYYACARDDVVVVV